MFAAVSLLRCGAAGLPSTPEAALSVRGGLRARVTAGPCGGRAATGQRETAVLRKGRKRVSQGREVAGYIAASFGFWRSHGAPEVSGAPRAPPYVGTRELKNVVGPQVKRRSRAERVAPQAGTRQLGACQGTGAGKEFA